MSHGKYVIAVMLIIGVVAAGISLWHHSRVSRHALEYWGQAGAKQILRAPKVVAVRLQGDAAGMPIERDASHSRGLVNIRQALLQDAAYNWEAAPPETPPQWQYALRFEGDGPAVTALFSFADDPRLLREGADKSLSLDPASARVLQAFLEEQFEDESPSN